MQDAKKQYEYYRRKLLREAQREGLTSQEEKLLKIVDTNITQLTPQEIRKKASRVKAEFKRIRQTKKYKSERKLRNQLYKLKTKYQKQELEREARRRLQNLPPAEDQLQGAFFKTLTYKKIVEEGITRHIDGKVVRYKGMEALKTQIKSLIEASDPERKKQRYIQIYIENLELNGIPEEYIDDKGNVRNLIKEMEKYLQSLDPKVLTYALDTGAISSIQFYYVIDDHDIRALAQKLEYYTSGEGRNRLMSNYKLDNEEVSAEVKLIQKERRLKEKIHAKQVKETKPFKNF